MPNYCVTISYGCFDVEADDEDDAREQALSMVEMDIEKEDDDDDDEEKDGEEDEG